MRGMNPVAMTVINLWKEYWPSRGSNQGPPVLTSAMLPTELWGSACGNLVYLFYHNQFEGLLNKVSVFNAFMTMRKRPSENNVDEGENAGKHTSFPLIPQCFLPYQR